MKAIYLCIFLSYFFVACGQPNVKKVEVIIDNALSIDSVKTNMKNFAEFIPYEIERWKLDSLENLRQKEEEGVTIEKKYRMEIHFMNERRKILEKITGCLNSIPTKDLLIKNWIEYLLKMNKYDIDICDMQKEYSECCLLDMQDLTRSCYKTRSEKSDKYIKNIPLYLKEYYNKSSDKEPPALFEYVFFKTICNDDATRLNIEEYPMAVREEITILIRTKLKNSLLPLCGKKYEPYLEKRYNQIITENTVNELFFGERKEKM